VDGVDGIGGWGRGWREILQLRELLKKIALSRRELAMLNPSQKRFWVGSVI